MKDLTIQITGLEDKIKLLISKQTVLINQNNELKKTNQNLLNQVEEQKKIIKKLEEEYKQVNNQSVEITENTNIMKAKINDLVKDIDQCIAQINA